MRPEICKKLDLIDRCDRWELGATTRNKASNIHDESQFFFSEQALVKTATGQFGKRCREAISRSLSKINEFD